MNPAKGMIDNKHICRLIIDCGMHVARQMGFAQDNHTG
jgi:hypothetical protein